MIQSYKKVLNMESVALLKLEQDKKILEKVRNILYVEKDFIIEKLIAYLNSELNTTYLRMEILDVNDNVATIIVKQNSKIFRTIINDSNYLNFDFEDLIDRRRFNNYDEIIIIERSIDEKVLNLGYLCDVLEYEYLSYSEEIKTKLEIFINYVINKKIKNNKRRN